MVPTIVEAYEIGGNIDLMCRLPSCTTASSTGLKRLCTLKEITHFLRLIPWVRGRLERDYADPG